MDAVEFIKDFYRLCAKENCIDCQLDNKCFLDAKDEISDEDAEYIYNTVEKWKKEHPKKTYFSVYKEKFPNSVDRPWMENVCIRTLYGDNVEKNCGFMNCDECWNGEVKE